MIIVAQRICQVHPGDALSSMDLSLSNKKHIVHSWMQPYFRAARWPSKRLQATCIGTRILRDNSHTPSMQQLSNHFCGEFWETSLLEPSHGQDRDGNVCLVTNGINRHSYVATFLSQESMKILQRRARVAEASLHIVAIPGDRYSKIMGKNIGTSDESSSWKTKILTISVSAVALSHCCPLFICFCIFCILRIAFCNSSSCCPSATTSLPLTQDIAQLVTSGAMRKINLNKSCQWHRNNTVITLWQVDHAKRCHWH